jgi:hypothetical protein
MAQIKIHSSNLCHLCNLWFELLVSSSRKLELFSIFPLTFRPQLRILPRIEIPTFFSPMTKEGQAMSSYLTEAKPQCWRAVAIFEDRREALLFLGRSSAQVRAGYVNAFNDVLDEEERAQIRSISLQRWNGAPDAGKWLQQTTLAVPAPKLVRAAA